jgi:hypothetical protein
MSEFDQGSLLSDGFYDEEALPVPGASPSVFGDDADTGILRVMALDLLNTLKRTGAPQSATRTVKNFAQAWNTAADTPIDASGKYTRETEAALNAALASLAPNVGVAPSAIL